MHKYLIKYHVKNKRYSSSRVVWAETPREAVLKLNNSREGLIDKNVFEVLLSIPKDDWR